MKRWNKKGMEPITIALIVIGLIAGLFIVNQVGLFTITPPLGTAGQPNSLINNYFYSLAEQSYQFDCALNSLVFRSGSQSFGSSSNWIVLFRDGIYAGYPYNSNAKNPSVGTNKISKIPFDVFENGVDLYIFNQDLNEPTGMCLRCKSSTSLILYKDISPGLCAGISDTFVKFRTTDTSYTTSTSIAIGEPYYNTLTSYVGTNGACTNINCQSASPIYSIPGGFYYMGSQGSDSCICFTLTNTLAKRFTPGGSISTSVIPTGTNEITYSVSYPTCDSPQYQINHYYYKYSRDDGAVSSSYRTGNVVSGTYQIWDDNGAGNQPYIWGVPRYTCRDNNVVLQYCTQNGSYSIIQNCEGNQLCKFYTAAETANMFNQQAVKCGLENQKYISSKQLCKDDLSSFFQTNADGSDINVISCPTNTGGRCFQDTNTISSKTAHCTQCSGTVTRCQPGNETIVEGCSGSGEWQASQTCVGDARCAYDSLTSSYTCKSGNIDGDLRCDPNNNKQRQIWHDTAHGGTNTWQNNGVECRTRCDTNNPTKCTDDCSWNNYESCSNGILYFCDKNSDIGNVISTTSPNAPKTCWYPFGSPSCEDSTQCSKPYDSGKTYCINGQLNTATVDSTDPLVSRGVNVNNLLYSCVYGCTESNPTGSATCIALDQCKRSGQKVCKDAYTLGVCNPYKDFVNTLASGGDCFASNHQFCDDTDPNADAFCNHQNYQCTGNKGCRDSSAIWGCDGGTGQGYWTTELGTCNNNGCTETTAGRPECKSDVLCAGQNFTGNFFTCDTTQTSWGCKLILGSNDWDNYQLIRDLSDYKSCSSTSCRITANSLQRCEAECSGTQTCVGDDVVSCDPSTGQKGAIKWGCNGKGCTNGNCNDECGGTAQVAGIPDSYSCSESNVNSRYCYKLYDIDGTTVKQRLLNLSSCVHGCDSSTGKCLSQCTGTSQCFNDKIYACDTTNERTTTILDDCMGIGCTEEVVGQPRCNNGCNPLDEDKNIACLNPSDQVVDNFFGAGAKSIICKKNATTNQYYNTTTSCGIAGCSNYKCVGNIQYANSFFCTGNNEQEIYGTDGNGVPINFIVNCKSGNVPTVNNLQPYCKNGRGVCTYCELNGYYCVSTTKTQFQCANETSGAIQSSAYCDAGCGNKDNGSPYCDELVIAINGATTFPTRGDTDLGDIDLAGTLKGSISGKPIAGASITATITGAGVNESSSTLVSGNDGSFSIPFHSKNKGTYAITLVVNGYTINNIKTIQTMITNSFIVSPYETQTIYIIPGYTPMFKVKVKNDRTGAVPDDLKISISGNLTTYQPKRSTSDPSIWEVTISTNSLEGQYDIGFKPSQGGTLLDEQMVSIEVAKPDLTATLNNPDSIASGKKEFKLQVSGPKYDNGILTTGGIQPDVTPKATITYNSQTSSLTLLDSGGGEYLISYDFKDLGTYTINIEATKSGYGTTKIAKIIQVSSSGTEAPPATDGSGNKNTATSSGGILGGITSGGMSTWFIVGIVVVVGYLIITGRKR